MPCWLVLPHTFQHPAVLIIGWNFLSTGLHIRGAMPCRKCVRNKRIQGDLSCQWLLRRWIICRGVVPIPIGFTSRECGFHQLQLPNWNLWQGAELLCCKLQRVHAGGVLHRGCYSMFMLTTAAYKCTGERIFPVIKNHTPNSLNFVFCITIIIWNDLWAPLTMFDHSIV